jgi:hypothetical protein
MTREEQDAIIGRTIRELRDVREALATLRKRAREFGKSFSVVAYHMNNSPECLRLSNEQEDKRLTSRCQESNRRSGEVRTPELGNLDISAVLSVRDEIKECIFEVEILEKTLADMGVREGARDAGKQQDQ